MPATLVLAPASAGKTQHCIERVHDLLRATPLAEVWVILPNRTQAGAFRRRLAERGGAMGVHVGTFGDLYAELLALASRDLPEASESVVHRFVQAAVVALAEGGRLPHHAALQRRPGFARALARLIAELKRARIEPPQFAAAVRGRGPRLEELAALYAAYQDSLIRLGWADPEGLGWLAVQALQEDATLPPGWRLLIADSFDSFTPTQLETLARLAGRVSEMRLTLSGEPAMPRPAHRRFARTLERVHVALAPDTEALNRRAFVPAPLAHLESALFDGSPAVVDAGGRVTFVEAQSQPLEAREALRWLKARVVRDGVKPEQCAVIARDLGPYRPFLREAGREFGMPIRFVGGEPLDRHPAVAAILNLLELSTGGWRPRPLLDVLRSPYFDLSAFGLGPRDAARFDAVARWGRVVEGLAQWREALDRLGQRPASPETGEGDGPLAPALPGRDDARRLWESLSGFAGGATAPVSGTLAEFVPWVRALLSTECGLGIRARVEADGEASAHDEAALAAFDGVLDTLVLAERVAGQGSLLTYEDFHVELRSAVGVAAYDPEADSGMGEAGLLAADLHAARGVPFAAVAVLGLSEGLFPAPLSEDPFLSDEERDALQREGLPLEPRLRSDQQTLFYEAVTRATEFLLLTRPCMAEDGETWEPSPYWHAARALFAAEPVRLRAGAHRPLEEAASPAELLEWAVRSRRLPGALAELRPEWDGLRHAGAVLGARQAREASGEFEGQVGSLAPALAERYGPNHGWSASRLEAYGHCGFRFFVGNALGLEPREPPEAGYDSAQLGSMLHEVLERVYSEAPDPADTGELLDRLPRVAQAVFEAAPERYGFRPTALWRTQRAELLALLQNTVAELAKVAAEFRPAYFEVRFGFDDRAPWALETTMGPIRLHGVIDRVDVAAGGRLRVIDYKTGASGLAPRDLVEGRRLQLPLYALAAESLGLGQVAEGFYWGIRSGEASSLLKLDRFDVETENGRAFTGVHGAMALAVAHVEAHVQGIRAGRFLPVPPRDGCPDHCPATAFCWRFIARER